MFTCRSRQILRLFNKINNPFCNRSINTINKTNVQFVIKYANEKSFCYNPNLEIIRSKHKDTKKAKKQDVSDSDEEDEINSLENEFNDKQTKVLTAKVNSLRADLILKAGLGIARNKIENMFYESKIRVNGKKLLKKSVMLSIGDEIDIVRGTSLSNPNFLTVSRVEILSATEKDEGLSVKLRRNKALLIDNYETG